MKRCMIHPSSIIHHPDSTITHHSLPTYLTIMYNMGMVASLGIVSRVYCTTSHRLHWESWSPGVLDCGLQRITGTDLHVGGPKCPILSILVRRTVTVPVPIANSSRVPYLSGQSFIRCELNPAIACFLLFFAAVPSAPLPSTSPLYPLPSTLLSATSLPSPSCQIFCIPLTE